MRDLELRGAGDLLGDEQSGHVAAVGFELYVAMLDEAVEALRAARRGRRGGGRGAGPARRRRRRLPAAPTTSPSRRRRSTSTAGSPAPASRASCGRCATSSATASARCPSRSRTCSSCSGRGSSSGPAGARTRRVPRRPAVDHRRSSSTPQAVGRLRERMPRGDVRVARAKTLSLRVPDEPGGAPRRGARAWPSARWPASAR